MAKASRQKKSSVTIGKQVVPIGSLGLVITGLIQKYAEVCPVQEELILVVPFFSAILVATTTWLYILIKPANGEAIGQRRNLKAKIKTIDEQMSDNNVSVEMKKKLQELRDKLSMQIVKIDDHK